MDMTGVIPSEARDLVDHEIPRRVAPRDDAR
jgi:hypothetical protein